MKKSPSRALDSASQPAMGTGGFRGPSGTEAWRLGPDLNKVSRSNTGREQHMASMGLKQTTVGQCKWQLQFGWLSRLVVWLEHLVRDQTRPRTKYMSLGKGQDWPRLWLSQVT